MHLGLTCRQLGNLSEATADLEPGIQLLPAATALNALADVRRVRAAVRSPSQLNCVPADAFLTATTAATT